MGWWLMLPFRSGGSGSTLRLLCGFPVDRVPKRVVNVEGALPPSRIKSGTPRHIFIQKKQQGGLQDTGGFALLKALRMRFDGQSGRAVLQPLAVRRAGRPWRRAARPRFGPVGL